MSKKKGVLGSRIAYSLGAFGHDAFYALLSTYFIMFVTGHLFNSGNKAFDAKMIGFMTTLIFFIRFLELFIDPFIGNMIDNTETRWGKFKPWVVGGGIISAVILCILFTDLGGLTKSNPSVYLLVFAILYIVMDVFYSFNDIGFWSMVPALSFDSHERDKIATWARVGSTVGAQLVGFVIMPMVLFFSYSHNHGNGDSHGWFVFAAIVTAIAAITAIGVGLFTHENHDVLRKNKTQTGFKDVLKILTKNDQLMWISISYLCYTSGVTLLNSFQLYYFTYVLGNADAYKWLGGLNTIFGLIAVMLFPVITAKYSRRRLFFVSIAIILAGIILYLFAGKSLVLILIAAELITTPQALVFLVVLMTITDCVEYGQLKLGHRDESLTLSVRPLLDKFAGAVSNKVVAWTAVIAGMTGSATAATVSAAGVAKFKFLMFGVPALLIIVGAILYFSKVKMDEKMHARIVDQLEKTWGKQFTEEGASAQPAGNAEAAKEIINGETPTDTTTGSAAQSVSLNLTAPVSGTVVNLGDVKEETFASGKMGAGIGIKPSDGKVLAPFAGTISAVFPTHHAVGITSDEGVVALIHVGVNTVNMQGTGFVSYVEEGQHVAQGKELLEFWDPAIKKAGYDDTVLFTVTNSSKGYTVEPLKKAGETVKAGEDLLKVTK